MNRGIIAGTERRSEKQIGNHLYARGIGRPICPRGGNRLQHIGAVVVIGRSPDEQIIAVVAVETIFASPADENVASRSSHELVGAGAAREDVVPISRGEEIVAVAAEEQVVS